MASNNNHEKLSPLDEVAKKDLNAAYSGTGTTLGSTGMSAGFNSQYTNFAKNRGLLTLWKNALN